MPLFRYKATSQSGNIDTGVIDARDQAAAVEKVRALALIPIHVAPDSAGVPRQSAASSKLPGIFQRSRVLQADVADLTRELATLLRSGLPLDRAMEILINLAAKPALGELLTAIRDDIRAGAALSSALERHQPTFSRFYIGMVRAGEAGGALGNVLGRISEFMERTQELKETVKSALIYPTILVLASVVSVMSLLVFVVPQFSQMFEQSGKALPLATQLVISAGDFLRHYWWCVPIGVFLLYRYVVWQTGTPERKISWDRRVLTTPLVGDLVTKVEVARLSRTLGTLLESGVPLLAGLTIVKDIVGNLVLSSALESAREQLKAGHGLSQPLMQQSVFPQLAVHMMSVGEETGQLALMLTRVADVYDREVAMAVKRMLALLEPVMILGLGLIIGGIIISILLAILKVNSLVG